MANHGNSSGCGCNDGCVKCNEPFTVQIDCCNKCGQGGCDSKSCCSSCNEGPMEVTDEELASECSWFWASIYRNCCLQPIRVSPNRFRTFLLEGVDFNDYIDQTQLNLQISEAIAAQMGGFVTNSAFITLSNKVTKNCQDIAAINQWIINSGNVTVDLSDYLTSSEINLLLGEYYTRTDVNNLIAGLQTQINSLQTQLDACDCGGAVFNAPTGDWADILSNVCPATTTTTVANPDGVPFTIATTGAGIVTVRVDGVVVSSPFTPADGATVEIEVTAAGGVNAVGIVTIGYDDGTNAGIVDGVQYDITCPAVNTNTDPEITCPADVTLTEGTAGSAQLSATDVDAGDTLTFSISGQPAGITVNGATGLVTIANTVAAGTYAIIATVNDGEGGTDSCTLNVEIAVDAVNFTSTTPAPCVSGYEDSQGNLVFVQDEEVDDWEIKTERCIITDQPFVVCGQTIDVFELTTITTGGFGGTETRELTHATVDPSAIISVEFASACAPPVSVNLVGTTQTSYIPAVHEAIRDNITCASGYTINVTCA